MTKLLWVNRLQSPGLSLRVATVIFRLAFAFLPCFLFLLAVSFAFPPEGMSAGWQSLAAVSSYKVNNGQLDLKSGAFTMRLSAESDSRIHVQVFRGAKPLPAQQYTCPAANSTRAKLKVFESKGFIIAESAELRIKINKRSLALQFEDKSGQVICRDLAFDAYAFKNSAFRISKECPLDEHYFALGDKTGPLDRRNMAFTFWNTDSYLWQESTDPLYKSFPFLLCMNGGKAYGIFLNNSYRSFFDLGKSERDAYSFGSEGGPLDYYFFYGPHPKKVVSDYVKLVGAGPLPPLFSLGYQQSRGSYVPEAKAREVAEQLRQHKIPCDVIYLDGDYKDKAGSFSVDRKAFPNFNGLIADLKSKGFATVISLDPYLAAVKGQKNFDEGVNNGYFARNPDGSVCIQKVWAPKVAFCDFTNPDARKWWGGLHETFVNAGVGGIWDDMNEPAVFERLDKTLPLNTVHSLEGRRADHREVHNLISMQNTRATYEGLLRLRPESRPFVLTRSAFSGSQRYAACWTGDNMATWNHMRISIPQLLNLGLSGMNFSGADIGGYSSFTNGPPEDLLTRWMQLGAFNTLYRNHSDGETRAREPWVDGPEHEAARRKFIEERYRLMPYIYSQMEEATRTGIPLMRPLFLEFPQEKRTLTIGEQFMFGSSLMIAPKVWEGAGDYPVLFPSGIWYDYFSSKPLEKDKLDLEPKLDELPIFVRGGSVIGRQALVQHLGQTPDGPLELAIYLGEKGAAGELYFDDGASFAYKQGQFKRLEITAKKLPRHIEVLIKSRGEYKPWFKQLSVRIVGVPGPVKSITRDGEALSGWKGSKEECTLPGFDCTDKDLLLDLQL